MGSYASQYAIASVKNSTATDTQSPYVRQMVEAIKTDLELSFDGNPSQALLMLAATRVAAEELAARYGFTDDHLDTVAAAASASPAR